MFATLPPLTPLRGGRGARRVNTGRRRQELVVVREKQGEGEEWERGRIVEWGGGRGQREREREREGGRGGAGEGGGAGVE